MLQLRTAAGRGTLAAAVLASGMAFLDSTVVNVALPALGADLNARLGDLQWVVNGYTLTLAAFVLLGGALGDRFGRRKVFLIGVVWFTVASLACGFAPNVNILIVARIVQGIGAALLTPGSLALLQASFEHDDRGKAIGAWSGLSGVTTALGPFIGGLLIDQASWRWIFWMNAPLAVLVCLLSLKYVPESRTPGAHSRFDIAGAVLCAAALGGLTYGLIAWPDHGLTAPTVLAGLSVALVGGVAFVLLERARLERAMMPLDLFKSRIFATLNVYTLFVYAALGGLFFFLVIFLQNVAGWSALQAGVASMPATLIMLLFSARSGALATRIGPRSQLIAGPLIGAVGLLLLSRLPTDPNYWVDVLPGIVLFGIGLTLLVAPLTATVLAAVEDDQAGVASGINNAAARTASLLAVATLPLLVGLSGTEYAIASALASGYRSAMLWCAALMLIGAALAALLARKPPTPTPTPAE